MSDFDSISRKDLLVKFADPFFLTKNEYTEGYKDAFKAAQHYIAHAPAINTEQTAYINLLEERIRGMQLQMMGDCGVCKHRDDTERCITCLFDKDHTHPLWEYEGFPTDMEKEG